MKKSDDSQPDKKRIQRRDFLKNGGTSVLLGMNLRPARSLEGAPRSAGNPPGGRGRPADQDNPGLALSPARSDTTSLNFCCWHRKRGKTSTPNRSSHSFWNWACPSNWIRTGICRLRLRAIFRRTRLVFFLKRHGINMTKT